MLYSLHSISYSIRYDLLYDPLSKPICLKGIEIAIYIFFFFIFRLQGLKDVNTFDLQFKI